MSIVEGFLSFNQILQLPPSFTLKMAAAVFAGTLEYLQQSTWLVPETEVIAYISTFISTKNKTKYASSVHV
jgi:hypothetical protein